MSDDLQISLGCGAEEKEGWIGLDIVDHGWNKIWDGRHDPIPVDDSVADRVEAHNFIEHVERRYWRHIFNEVWRVLKPKGFLDIVVPNAHHIGIAWADITHVSAFVPGTLKYLCVPDDVEPQEGLTPERPRNADYGFKPWYSRIVETVPNEERVLHIVLEPCK